MRRKISIVVCVRESANPAQPSSDCLLSESTLSGDENKFSENFPIARLCWLRREFEEADTSRRHHHQWAMIFLFILGSDFVETRAISEHSTVLSGHRRDSYANHSAWQWKKDQSEEFLHNSERFKSISDKTIDINAFSSALDISSCTKRE